MSRECDRRIEASALVWDKTPSDVVKITEVVKSTVLDNGLGVETKQGSGRRSVVGPYHVRDALDATLTNSMSCPQRTLALPTGCRECLDD